MAEEEGDIVFSKRLHEIRVDFLRRKLCTRGCAVVVDGEDLDVVVFLSSCRKRKALRN